MKNIEWTDQELSKYDGVIRDVVEEVYSLLNHRCCTDLELKASSRLLMDKLLGAAGTTLVDDPRQWHHIADDLFQNTLAPNVFRNYDCTYVVNAVTLVNIEAGDTYTPTSIGGGSCDIVIQLPLDISDLPKMEMVTNGHDAVSFDEAKKYYDLRNSIRKFDKSLLGEYVYLMDDNVRTQVLMSRSNPDGKHLEVLLEEVRHDLRIKNEMTRRDFMNKAEWTTKFDNPDETRDKIIYNNSRIIEMLELGVDVQNQTMSITSGKQ